MFMIAPFNIDLVNSLKNYDLFRVPSTNSSFSVTLMNLSVSVSFLIIYFNNKNFYSYLLLISF
jgi:hypothetical protein